MRRLVGAAVVAFAVAAAHASGAASPGQGRIAFALDRNGVSQIYTVRPDGTGLRRLTFPPTRQLLGGDSGPVWSPDGRRIAFERDLPYWGEDRFRLAVTSARGGRARELTTGPFDVMPSWAPDGGRIAFVRVARAAGAASVYTIDSVGGTAAQLVAGHLDLTPAWSPDGRTIAFARLVGTPVRTENAELFLADADGSHVRPLGVRGISPAWSPDGTRIAFVSFADRNGSSCEGDECVPSGEIYVANADGSALRRLTTSRQDDEHPTWSPDGTRIAFASGLALARRGHAPRLLLVPAAGGAAHRIGRFSGVLDPAWSPAGVR